jgi:DNA-binding MarR family transcriptional regulator
MEHRGLITRGECAADGRGAVIELTTAGAGAIATAAPRHVATVRRLIFDQLSEEQQASFEETCAAIITALGAQS